MENIENKKKIIVIGAGLSGLATGVYSAASGFDVTIFEKHNIAGGLCSNWKRGGYTFEGGLHWLTGSKEGRSMNKVWREIGALKNDTKIFVRDPYITYNQFGKEVHFFRDIKKLEEHLIEISPEDERAIKRLCKNIIRFSRIEVPVKMTVGQVLGMIPAGVRVKKYSNMIVQDFIKEFKNPLIQGFLNSIIGGEFSMTSFLYTMGLFASGDGGYVDGGSRQMVQNIVEKLESLGGKIKYKTAVKEVIIENGRAIGVLLENGEKDFADNVVVTTDTSIALDNMFSTPLHESWTDVIRNYKHKSKVSSFLCLGVEVDLKDTPKYVEIELDEPLVLAGQAHTFLDYAHYAHYDGYQPQGCSAITLILMGDTYDYWKEKKENGTYKEEKERFANAIIERLVKHLPQIEGKIKVIDVATPLTYERYVGTYHGAWMSKNGLGESMRFFPQKSETVKNLYFAGFRMFSPGGLPPAAVTGRKVAKLLCKDNKMKFKI
ncbi:MAG: NAD(P)/FAD-dependent oxidoreductase [Firmicutes bacterium]|nr:NAD(P)/FAD-dependent oxidoreductase [Bacillota bacterium]MCL2255938.1 NAD(P)/FAD-dependent oxidoreductase [Bacillota bacterium]